MYLPYSSRQDLDQSEHLVPTWVPICCLGRFRWCSLAGGSTSLWRGALKLKAHFHFVICICLCLKMGAFSKLLWTWCYPRNRNVIQYVINQHKAALLYDFFYNVFYQCSQGHYQMIHRCHLSKSLDPTNSDWSKLPPYHG